MNYQNKMKVRRLSIPVHKLWGFVQSIMPLVICKCRRWVCNGSFSWFYSVSANANLTLRFILSLIRLRRVLKSKNIRTFGSRGLCIPCTTEGLFDTLLSTRTSSLAELRYRPKQTTLRLSCSVPSHVYFSHEKSCHTSTVLKVTFLKLCRRCREEPSSF